MRFALAAALVLALVAACSDGARRESTPTRSKAQKGPKPALAVRIPVKATASRGPKKFASKRELEWAAAWNEWYERVDNSFRSVERILADPDRRAWAAQASSRVAERLEGALRMFRSCADDAVARGAPPSTRLEPVAVETAAVCERLAKAVARLEAGFEDGMPGEAVFAADHLEAALREARSFVPGLNDEIDDLPLLDKPSRRSRIQLRYTFTVSRLAGEQVTISCYSPDDWRRKLAPMKQPPGTVGGFVHAHGATGHLAPVVCHWLDRFTYRKNRPEEFLAKANTAQALVVLAHEAQHVLGIRNEAKAECYGMQRLAPLAQALGANASYARELSDLFWTRMYPFEPPAYRSSECRPGGALDLRRRDPSWP